MKPTVTIDGMVGWINITASERGAILDVGGEDQCHMNCLELLELKHAIENIIEKQVAAK